ncbi:MAG: hypothetical protein V2J20_11210 [Wenzhouxiangella sp.]|nr:hypothetical protein [Wenzhouxiangella sp.]
MATQSWVDHEVCGHWLPFMTAYYALLSKARYTCGSFIDTG